jgi:hypothetical protein
MNHAVIGARVHSGWAAVLAVSGDLEAVQILDRRRIAITDSTVAGATQPYHFAEKLKLPDAEKHLANCAAVSECLASAAIREMVEELRIRDYQVAGCAIVLAAGRPLPGLADVLASHALIHTAEGEFFRRSLRKACEGQGIAVTGIRERDLDERVKETFGTAAGNVRERLADVGRSLGPPWTQDQKSAALVAWIVLAGLCGQTYSKAPSASVD